MSTLKFLRTLFAVFLILSGYEIGVQSVDPMSLAVTASTMIARPIVNKWIEKLMNWDGENIDHSHMEEIAYLSDQLEKATQQTLNQIKKMHLKNRYDRNKEHLYSLMHSIQHEYMRAFKDVFNTSLSLDESVVKEYSESVKGFSGNILEEDLKAIAGLTNSYLDSYTQNIQNHLNEMCDVDNSPQWFILNETLKIAFTYVQAAQIADTAIIYLDNNKNLTKMHTELKLNHLSLERRLQELKNDAKMYMKTLPNAIWRCDPKKHILSGTYTELQAVPIKRLAYGLVKYDTCVDGYLEDCQDLPNNFEFCVSDRSTSATFSYINWNGTENFENFGTKEDCGNRPIIRSNPTLLSFGQSFEICNCEKESSYNKICTESVRADLDYIVTGVRFSTIDRIIYLQIQQGKMDENGTIDVSTIHWKEVKRCESFSPLFIHAGTGVVLSGIDIPDQVLVGLKLSSRLVGNHSIISLMVIMKPNFNNFIDSKEFEKDQMNYLKFLKSRQDLYPNAKKYYYKFWDKPNLNETVAKWPVIETPGTPSILTNEKSYYANPKKISLVRFRRTDFKSDLGHRIVPLIDSRKVTQRIPLTGAGLYLKSGGKSSGFIGIKIFRPNLKYEIDEIIPDDSLDSETVLTNIYSIGK